MCCGSGCSAIPGLLVLYQKGPARSQQFELPEFFKALVCACAADGQNSCLYLHNSSCLPWLVSRAVLAYCAHVGRPVESPTAHRLGLTPRVVCRNTCSPLCTPPPFAALFQSAAYAGWVPHACCCSLLQSVVCSQRGCYVAWVRTALLQSA